MKISYDENKSGIDNNKAKVVVVVINTVSLNIANPNKIRPAK